MKTIVYIPNVTQVNDIGYQVSIQDIQNIPKGSCNELIVYDCIDYIDIKQKMNLLDVLLSTIRYGGEIVLEGADLEEIARALTCGQISADEARKYLYKGNNIFGCNEVISYIESRGFHIKHKRVNNYVYSIRAERPSPKSN